MNDQSHAQLHALVIGGGASGVLAAFHLLRASPRSRVTLVERSDRLGAGIAYGSPDPDHLLNTRVVNMSALPNDPDHFLHWLQADGQDKTPGCFVSRQTYGRYLESLLDPWRGSSRLVILQGEAIRLVESRPRRVTLHLEDGRRVSADHALLATGHARPRPTTHLEDAWETPGQLPRAGRVAILGTGLSMVDQVISLLKSGHQGEILAMSRRGLLPQVHHAGQPRAIQLAAVPLGAQASEILRWLRLEARAAEAAGGTWRDAVDGLRPYIRALWSSLPVATRSRFLRHGAAWWEVHRHRLPPESAALLQEAQARGQLILQRGAFLDATREGDGVTLRYRPRGTKVVAGLQVAAVIDCRGIRRDPEAHATPLVQNLLADGLARIDPLRIGLETDRQAALVDARGLASPIIHAVGPTARAALWEITAVPDIRSQCAELAARLTQPHPAF
ncbi:FAD/NAD(P)-binding protein [Gemmobacter serpentinus]|uniref:FAD/NAD(P)-binding protein n=1 Tax=Gemmobacter serpentinus TaxID=2652247 RepID=UPI00124EA0A9|nr:FAD/NAD(P)-binding protein [Gemmobacter serpentinus]